MKNKLLFLTGIISALLISSVAYAGEASFDKDTKKVSIIGEFNPNESVSIVVFKPNNSIASVSSKTSMKNSIFFAYETLTDDNGKYDISFPVDGEGVCKINLSTKNTNEEIEIELFSETELKQALLKLNEAVSQGETAVESLLADSRLRNVLGIDEPYNKIFDKSKLNKALLSVPNYNNFSEVKSAVKIIKDEIKCVEEFNNVMSTVQIKSLVEDMYKCIPADKYLNEYLNSSNRTTIDKILLNAKPYSRIEDIHSKLIEGIDSVKNNNNSGTVGGGGSGPSGGVFQPNSSGSTNIVKYTNEDVQTSKDNGFIDVAETHWAYYDIKQLTELDVINGIDSKHFAPDNYVTREQFVKILVVAFDIKSSNNIEYFSDFEENAWYIPYIMSAKDAGIANGYADGSFGIGDNITREDLAVLAYNTAIKSGVIFNDGVENSFSDFSEISDYAKESVLILSANGIINGFENNVFSPKSFATRAQAAKIVNLLLKLKETGVWK